jgi:hypothetical protein
MLALESASFEALVINLSLFTMYVIYHMVR